MTIVILGAVALCAILILPALKSIHVVIVLVAARSLCDFGIIAGTRPLGLAYVSIAIIGISIYLLAINLISHSVPNKLALWIYICFALILVWSLIGISVFGIRTALLWECLRLLSIVAIFVLAYMSDIDRSDVYKFILSMYLPAVVISLLGEFGILPNMMLGDRLSGTFSHPNAAGAFFGFSVCITFLFWLQNRAKHLTIGLVLSSMALLLTGSLGGIAATIAGCVVSILTVRSITKSRKLTLFALGGAIILAAYFIFGLRDRVKEFSFASGVPSASSSPDSFEWRIENWHRLLKIWGERPMLGTGLGTTSNFIMPLGGPPHSLYVQILVEMGVLGMAAVAIAILYALKFVGIRSKKDKEISAQILVCLSFVGINGIVSNIVGYTAAVYLIAATVGICFVSNRDRARAASEMGYRSYAKS